MPPLIPLLASLGAHAADCPAEVPTADLASSLDRAEASYADLDLDTFEAELDAARAQLPCLSEPLPRDLAASLHRMEGLQGFLDRDASRSTSAFAAARSIEPDYRFPTSLVPEGHPVQDEYVAIDPASGEVEAVAPPAEGHLRFDGSRGTERPASFPAVVQVLEGSGAVASSAYLWPGDPLPDYVPASTPLREDGGAVAERGPRRGLLIGAGVGAVAAGALYGVAGLRSARYHADGTTYEQLDPLRAQTNALVVASGATAAVALGLGTSALLVGRF